MSNSSTDPCKEQDGAPPNSCDVMYENLLCTCFHILTSLFPPFTYSEEKKIFDPLLILYVCPLTKKWSVYNFNGRFIWTVRDRITKKTKNKKQKYAFKKSYKLVSILMSEISIWPLCKTWHSTWWQNPCWKSQRSEFSCSWPPGLHTSQEGFWPTPLCRSSPSH